MKYLLFSIVLLALYISEALTIKCYNCTSHSVAETDGCHNEGELSDDFLVECGPGQDYCGLLKVEGEMKGQQVTGYTRSCQTENRNGCIPYTVEEGVSTSNCFLSCQEDGCNGVNTIPAAPGSRVGTVAPPSATESTKAPKPEGTPEPASKTGPNATPEPKSEPKATPEPATEAPNDYTTGDAQSTHIKVHAIINLLICFVIAVITV